MNKIRRKSVMERRGPLTSSSSADILTKQFHDFGLKPAATPSLDSLEKILYSEFYGWKREKTDEIKTKSKSKAKKIDVKTRIDEVFSRDKPLHKYKPIDIPALKKISKHLSQFQQIEHLIRQVRVDKEIDTSKSKGVSWKNQKITETFSKNIIDKKYDRSVWTGPGSYVPLRVQKLRLRNIGFGTTPRFGEKYTDTPGPGTYGKNENLHIAEKSRKKPTTLTPSFEWPIKQRGEVIEKGLPPNQYKVKDGKTINERINRRVTIRGPYDVFTGPRDSSTIKNHFAPSTFSGTPTWPMSLPSMVDELNYSSKKHKGRWGESERLLLTLPKYISPAPNQYQKVKIKIVKQNKYGFNSSNVWPWSAPLKKLPVPGPGRYNPHRPDCCRSHQASSKSAISIQEGTIEEPIKEKNNEDAMNKEVSEGITQKESPERPNKKSSSEEPIQGRNIEKSLKNT